MGATVQVVGGDGKVNASSPWFPEDAELGAEALTVVSVVGAQGSGKSSLLNAVMGTDFAVAKPGGSLGSATTLGVSAAKSAKSDLLMAFDVEGADGRAREGRAGKKFGSNLVSFAAALSDVVLLNVFVNEIGNVNSTVFELLTGLFTETFKAADQDGATRTALAFVVRDVDESVSKEDLKAVLIKDAGDLWASISKGSTPLDKFFEMSVISLPHYKYAADEFQSACQNLLERLSDNSSPDFLAKTEFSKGIPADGFAAFAKQLWDSVYVNGAAAEAAVAREIAEGGSSDAGALSAADTAFSLALAAADIEIGPFKEKVNGGDKVADYGSASDEILARALEKYDDGTAEFTEDASVARKRRELSSVVDLHLGTVFLKNLQLIREGALQVFKNAIASDQIHSDMAFYSTVRNFVQEAEQSVRPGSDWTFATERTDLEAMMQDISSQQKRLLSTQLAAGQQQAQAMQYLQMQQANLQSMQQQAYGGSGAAGNWNVGAAYRPPDTNVNLSLGYQQGRTNIQISMVPDEQASLLGPNGFTAGVGPANLGLSFNINL